MGVAGEAAREVLAHISIGDLLRAIHQNFCAVVELWRTVHGEQEGEGLLEHERVLSVAKEAIGVVVFDECHDIRRVLVEIVVDERVVDAVVAVPPTIGLLVLGLVEFVEEREVHNRFELRVES